MKFETGDQVVYIPAHAAGDHRHPDSEYGFVMSTGENAVTCRFWNFEWIGRPPAGSLPRGMRTSANSERCSPRDLRAFEVVPQWFVERARRIIAENGGFYPFEEDRRRPYLAPEEVEAHDRLCRDERPVLVALRASRALDGAG